MKTKLFYWGGLLCLFFIAGCSGNKSHHYETASADTTAIVSNNSTEPGMPKLLKVADMHFKVKDVRHTGEAISVLTAALQGTVMHHSLVTAIQHSTEVAASIDSTMRLSSYNVSADMTVKIPSDRMEDFMNQVGHMAAFVDTSNMDIQDKTLDLLASHLKAPNRDELIAKQKQANNIDDLLAQKSASVDKQMDIRRVEDAVKYSTVGLKFYQNNTVTKELVANDDALAYSLPFTKRLGNAFINGWVIFDEGLIAIANIWVLLLFIIVAVFGYKRYKRKPSTGVL
ncbi:DUF4349 domain-containing protein [Mucilaginibacter sp. HMF5004]|uniref:DUF4349 domain-containing protein n=1 Tax=Mucilaginibacter rivuli TaxID=2857527 RepID=UPI001C601D9D|nr:DUF4349 domain-containing protein [Mucilaginibacter rivuli]MBW4888435.1 DUF4349 domain-containing protein [Mucilaginibacter rivuli]